MISFFQGLTLGLAYVAPIGVQNLFVINTGLSQDKSRAYQVALIVIFFDITLALACFFGVGLLLDQFDLLKKAVLLIGGLVVCIMGVMLLKPKKDSPEKEAVNEEDPNQGDTDEAVKELGHNQPILKVIGTACVVTWFNPQAWIDGSLLLGAFRASLPTEKAMLFILGVTMASCIWFLTLATIVTLFKNKFSPKVLKVINIVCSIVILLYGIKLILTFFK